MINFFCNIFYKDYFYVYLHQLTHMQENESRKFII